MDIVFEWIEVTYRAPTLGALVSWIGQDQRRKSAEFQTKIMIIMATTYYTWRARNYALHRNAKWTVRECVYVILKDCRDRIQAKCKFDSSSDLN